MAKKSAKKPQKSPLIRALDNFSVPLCLIAGIFLAIPFSQQFASLTPSTLISTAAMFTVMLFSLYAVYAILTKERLFKLTRTTIYFIATVTFLSLIVIAWGLLRDLAGEDCVGLFGVTIECVTNHYFLLILIPLNPYFLLFTALMSVGALLIQLHKPAESAV